MRSACLALSACAEGGSSADLAPRSDCTVQVTSDLPGVSLAVQGPCELTLAQATAGVSYRYQLVVAADLASVNPGPGQHHRHRP